MSTKHGSENASSLTMETYLFAYLDILGSKKRMSGDQSTQFLNQVYSSVIACEKKIKKLSDMTGIESKVKVFSDNICIAVKNEPPSKYSDFTYPSLLNYLCVFSSLVQDKFLSNDLLMRGAITRGELYIDDTLIYGPALVRAYKMESSLAIYPRIIIDRRLKPTISSFVNEHLGAKHNQRDLAILAEDHDGELFIDYLGYQEDGHVRDSIKGLCLASLSNTKEYKQKICNDRTQQKYSWHKKYLIRTMASWNTSNGDVCSKITSGGTPKSSLAAYYNGEMVERSKT